MALGKRKLRGKTLGSIGAACTLTNGRRIAIPPGPSTCAGASTSTFTCCATVLFGPAARPLPQLPITTDSQGYLVAQSDFNEPVGPSFWERG